MLETQDIIKLQDLLKKFIKESKLKWWQKIAANALLSAISHYLFNRK